MTLKSIPHYQRWLAVLLAATAFSLSAAPATNTVVVQADTYVSSGQPTQNFGSMGAMEIAVPTSAQSRTQESLIRFNTAAIKTAFDTLYGTGNWTISAITLTLFSNFSTAGQQPSNTSFNKIAAGNFEFEWLSNDAWSETGITWNTISTVLPGTGTNELSSLGTFYWGADGSTTQTWTLNLDQNLINDIYAGDLVSIFGQPTADSTVGYLFNTLNNNPARLNIVADINPVPEPSTMALAAGGLAGWMALRRRKG